MLHCFTYLRLSDGISMGTYSKLVDAQALPQHKSTSYCVAFVLLQGELTEAGHPSPFSGYVGIVQ